ncbi:MAG TPA: DUF4440 domain-containing protein [Bacteroidota bacterium]|nr:DUF4440 domain-containing protein [Bacteroidota bacterium]
MIRLALVGVVFCWISLNAQTPSARSEINALLNDQVAAWNRGELEGYMAGYWKSDSTVFSSDGLMMRGYDEVLKRYRARYGTQELMGKLEFREVEVQLLSSTIAVATGVWKLERKNDTPWGRFTLILQKKFEGWRITHDHTSSSK